MRARVLHALRDQERDGTGVRGLQGARLLLTKAVLFDAGNTLVYIDPERMVEILRSGGSQVDVAGFRAAELDARHRLQERVSDGHAGTEPEVWREYFLVMLESAGVPAEGRDFVGKRVREVHATDHLWTHVEPGTTEVLARLLDEGYRLGVISNADGRMESVLESTGLTKYLEFVIDSEVVGVEKPDPAIFDAAVSRLNVEAEACVYVGDLYPVDYVGARGAGLDAVLFDPLCLHDDVTSRISDLTDLPGALADPTRRS